MNELTLKQQKKIRDKELKDINEQFADMAEAILKVAELGDVIDNSPLKRTTIELLIARKSGLYMNQVREVLDALPNLKDYLKSTSNQPSNKE
jgi:hypothetical protein